MSGASVRHHLDSSHESRAARGFIWFAAQDWWYHNQAHSDFQLMKEVARSRPVLVVNSLGLRRPGPGISTNPGRRILRKLRSMTRFLRRPLPELPNFHVYTPLMLPVYGSNGPLYRLNALLIRCQVGLAARLSGVPRAPAVGATIPTAWPVVEKMARSALIFNRSDLQSAFPEADGQWVADLERQFLSHADHVLYVSHELMRRDEPLVGARSFFIDHGVDLDHFSKDGPVHPDIQEIPRPRIGFFGGLDDYVVDMKLLAGAARALPQASLVLIGDATCPMDELTELANVHWLGFRDYREIPSLGRGFDAAIMPWLDNEWIRFANPIKIKEYLALGLPVVTMDYPEVEAYRGQVRVAADRSAFVDELRAALADPGAPDQRAQFVRPYSWAGRAEALLEIAGER
ncbi:MAG: glycosyltransferase [Acidipropionibacterium sp.]|jgi:glycosyltransferase involved in cell wall biosynthesis|nr:glycosyltransferase [Acidipropionibacterium sp.]